MAHITPDGATQPTWSPFHVTVLASRGIDLDTARAYGVRPITVPTDLPDGCPDYWTADDGYLPGLLFTWRSPRGRVEYQLRPDTPVAGDGRVRKYVFGPDVAPLLHAGKPVEEPDCVLITEGTCQTIATAAAVPDGVAVYGIAGCQSWMSAGVPTADLAVVDGHDVLIALDADAATNRAVYDAGVKLREAVLLEGATSVRFIRVPGGAKSGLDDVLGEQPVERRTRYLERLIDQAMTRAKADKPELPAAIKPKPKRADEDGAENPYFIEGSLQVKTLSQAIRAKQPAALTAERRVALYRDGVFRIDGTAFLAAVTEELGEEFRQSHHGNVEAYTIGQLAAKGIELPDRLTDPMLNVRNGMLDLRTGELMPHDPSWMSTTQLPVEWHPDAHCPTYDLWAKDQIGDQLDDLEETTATMLDPSLTPSRAVFLFGPSRSGKSTFLRLMLAIAGTENTSGVSLHQLAEDRFAAANVFGKILNVSADLSSAHVDDISLFKLMTGEDVIQANRKYGAQFAFTNRALFAFSANELPTVGESSRAYSERIKPFLFGHSFAGAENPELEKQMLGEAPGILRRWVAAYQRRVARGRMLDTASEVREVFELASDKVRQFVDECLEIIPPDEAVHGQVVTTQQIYSAFKEWTQLEGRMIMSRSKVVARLTTLQGLEVVRQCDTRTRGWNVRILPKQRWGQSDMSVSNQDHRAERAKLSQSYPDVDLNISKMSILNEGEKNISPRAQQDRASSARSAREHEPVAHALPGPGTSVTLPGLPGPRTGDHDPITEMFIRFGDSDIPQCPVHFISETLIDSAWWVCPSCHPDTARS